MALTSPNLGEIIPKLGVFTEARPMEKVSLSNALFSGVQRRVLALIFGHPESSFYAAEIVRKVNSGPGAVDRELARLQNSGLVCMERLGKQKHYRANPNSPIYHELLSLVRKTMGLREPLRQALESFSDKIKTAFVYGSVAKETDTAQSDIDLMIIGEDLTYSDIYKELDATEKALKRPVNPNVLAIGDWQRKLKRKDSFVSKINAQPKLFIIGTEDDLRI
jgi:predicted nucleotidyltransferase